MLGLFLIRSTHQGDNTNDKDSDTGDNDDSNNTNDSKVESEFIPKEIPKETPEDNNGATHPTFKWTRDGDIFTFLKDLRRLNDILKPQEDCDQDNSSSSSSSSHKKNSSAFSSSSSSSSPSSSSLSHKKRRVEEEKKEQTSQTKCKEMFNSLAKLVHPDKNLKEYETTCAWFFRRLNNARNDYGTMCTIEAEFCQMFL